APSLPPGSARAAADRLAAQVLAGSRDTRSVERLGASGDLLHAAAIIRSKNGQAAGIVVATDYLTGDLAARSRRMTQAYEDYQQMRVLKQPLAGVYLSFFLMVTLLILFGATWMGSYLAKRITRPVQLLAAAAREIGAGHLDRRIEPQSNDEFGALVDAFNTMAGELETSRRKVERSTIELEQKHVEVEGRRRYIETILERITTGVVSVDAAGAITTINSAASRLLGLDRAIVGQPAISVFDRADLQPLRGLLAGVGRGPAPPAPQEKALVEECSQTIIGEVESLKGLVDEFSQFARMPSPRTVPTDLGQLITDTIALYNGIFTEVRIEQRFAPGVPLVRLDSEQIRRVMINLIDNAIEAMERRG